MSFLINYFSVINIFSNILSFVMPNPALQKISEYVCYLQREQEFDLCIARTCTIIFRAVFTVYFHNDIILIFR